MTKPVDRGSLLNGQDRTSRDSRIPFSFPRSLDNFSLPDKRARRRMGYGSVHEHVRTQALCKHTGVTMSKRLFESGEAKSTYLSTPLSYGVIRWQSDYQPVIAGGKTVEFMLRLGEREELVTNPFQRIAHYDTGGSPTPAGPAWSNYSIRKAGVYVYDQTLLSNHHIFHDGGIDAAGNLGAGTQWDLATYKVLTAQNYDVFALTALSIGYNESEIFVEYDMVLSDAVAANREYRKVAPLVYSISTYTPGDIYHVAIVYSSTDVRLYVNGSLADTNTLPASSNWKFAGEYDYINEQLYSTGQKRDIVLLNECTARGSYQSACRVNTHYHGNQTFHHAWSASNGLLQLPPWALSPPRGTAMWDLRWWNEERNAATILANANRRILPTDSGLTNLKGNWWLNDGSVVCENKVTNLETRYCSVHHSYPGYVNNSELLNGIGIKLDDGQHIIRSFVADERDLGVGIAAKIGGVFGYNPTSPISVYEHRQQNDFTVQIQITVPDAFQPELNIDLSSIGGSLTGYDLGGTEATGSLGTGRISLYAGGAGNNAVVHLRDGTANDSVAATNRRLLDFNHSAAGPTYGAHAPYDMTLWSIEGTQLKGSETTSKYGEPERRRIPVARGLINPDGYVVFELYKNNSTNATGQRPRVCRLVSSTQLTVGKTYTLTFIQRARFTYNSTTRTLNATGWDQEIWIENITDSIVPTTHDVQYAHPAEGSAYSVASYSIPHEMNYDIIIGASYVNSGWDVGVSAYYPYPAGAPSGPWYTSHHATSSNRRGNHGPWPVPQHFMNPYQDQPGNFVVGMFRLWSVAVPEGDIQTTGSASLGARQHTPDLLVNLEFEEVTGIEVPNKCRYPDSFKLGYKGWGAPQGNADQRITYPLDTAVNLYLMHPLYDSPWSQEDCLGYIKIDNATYDARQSYTKVRGILPFKSSYAQQYGVIGIYNDSLAFDEDLDNTYQPLYLTNHGQMSDFTPSQDWHGTVVGDRLIMTGPGGLPKVWNGKHGTVAGFKQWSGGTPMAYPGESIVVSPGLTSGKWYGVAVVYWAEGYGIYHVSPRVTVYLNAGTTENCIHLFFVPQHPDPRVTIVEVYRTPAQDTEALAKSFPLYKTRISAPTGIVANSNAFAMTLAIGEADADLSLTVLDENITEFPNCALSAGLNDKLFLAADPVNPDTIYWTDPGNPERIDKIANSLTLPEGSGDAITAIISAFNAVFVFKPNAIWRIDDLGGNRHQVTKLFNIGAVSQKAVELITDPETGRAMIIYWSEHGPYIFDGSSNQYIGGAIEESSYTGSAAAQYNWVDPSSVVIGHNSVAREILFFYTPKRTDSGGSTTTMDRNGEAMVYNYRVRSWYHFNGMAGECALSLSINTSTVEAGVDAAIAQTVSNVLLLGSPNGKIFSWGVTKYDAAPSGLVASLPLVARTLTRPGTDEFIISGLTPTLALDLLDVWVTFVHTDTGEWITLPIISTDVTTGSVTVSSDWQVNSPFNINTTDVTDMAAYVCQPPASVEFPWDELEAPFYDKQIINLITWHDKLCYYKLLFNYDSSVVVKQWSTLTDSTSQRKRTNLARIGRCEAVKLHLMSFALDAAIDAYAYEVQYNMRGVTPQ